MYSAVLMLALTAGSETADFGHNRCNCSSACSGYVACSSSCHGGRLFGGHRGHGCSACSGAVYSCASSCSSSCHGGGHGLFGRHRCNGCNGCSYSACSGYSGCSGYTGCCSSTTVVVPSGDMKKMEKIEKKPLPDEKKVKPAPTPATINITLPADARLFVDGAPTTSTTDRRVLVTPDLQPGSTYVYTMVAEIVRDGRTVSETQQVNVRGGETSTVNFQFAPQGVATR
jgi:uncharacterized protein (TIGR03000 family)